MLHGGHGLNLLLGSEFKNFLRELHGQWVGSIGHAAV